MFTNSDCNDKTFINIITSWMKNSIQNSAHINIMEVWVLNKLIKNT